MRSWVQDPLLGLCFFIIPLEFLLEKWCCYGSKSSFIIRAVDIVIQRSSYAFLLSTKWALNYNPSNCYFKTTLRGVQYSKNILHRAEKSDMASKKEKSNFLIEQRSTHNKGFQSLRRSSLRQPLAKIFFLRSPFALCWSFSHPFLKPFLAFLDNVENF